MRFDVFTLFPNLFTPFLGESILKRAIEMGYADVQVHDIRAHAHDKHHITDDYPYGGGGGMLMKPEPIFMAVESVLGRKPPANVPIILFSPQGRTLTQDMAQALAALPRVALICGRYEGVDERVRQHLATDELSIGDYVLNGGELPAMVVIEAVTRLIPGVLGDPRGAQQDSFASGLLEHPHYTRPAQFRGLGVPDVLLSGNHAEIARWRRQEALRRTYERRPDLLEQIALSETDRQFLATLKNRSSHG